LSKERSLLIISSYMWLCFSCKTKRWKGTSVWKVTFTYLLDGLPD